MRKEWFEPGPDGISPFERLSKTKGFGAAGTAAAFRALLAGEDCGRTADANDAEIARLRAEAERLTAERDDMTTRAHDECQRANNWKDECQFHKDRAYTAIAERDALQARVDAGVRVWGSWSVFGGESSRDSSDTHTALLIDARPIADADERKGERRKVIPARIRRDGFDYSMDYDTPWMTNRRKYDRRRTAGTIADRGKA